MSATAIALRRKMEGADDLKSVVRTMKALAASSIIQYEESVRALADYSLTVELGLTACFRQTGMDFVAKPEEPKITEDAGAIVFGTDQGLVGQFNDVLADFVTVNLNALPGKKTVWSVGERIHARLEDSGLLSAGVFAVPNSVTGITPMLGRLLIETEVGHGNNETPLFLFYNRPKSGSGGVYEPVRKKLLPLDRAWRLGLSQSLWPTRNLPEVVGDCDTTVRALIREYLFVTLFKACAESLASENASRLAAMQRAEKNIDGMLEELNRAFHQLRQRTIDEELFDVISGYESLTNS